MPQRLNVRVPSESLGNFANRQAKEVSRLSNFLLIDIRVLFIIISVYTTVAAVISTAAQNEATKDTTSETPFNVTDRPEHMNVIVKEVSNAILWDCRGKSVTRRYYKSLYGILFTSFGITVLIFIGARLTVMCGWRSKLSHNLHKILWRLVLIKRLKQLVIHYGANDPRTKKKAELYYEQWDSEQQKKVHWTISAVPYFEALFLVLALPFILTSYDIHPLGCVVGPDEDSIRYFSNTSKVELDFRESLLVYQKFALGATIIIMVPIVIFGFILVWRYKKITKGMGKEVDKIAGRIEMPEDEAIQTSGFQNKLGLACVVANTMVTETVGGLKEVMQSEIPMENLKKTISASLYETNELDDENNTTL